MPDYKPSMTPEQMAVLNTKGRKAWADVPDGAQYIREVRGIDDMPVTDAEDEAWAEVERRQQGIYP